MLIEVHYGDGGVLLVNGNCRSIHLINYIQNHCCLSPSIKFDLCLMSNGEPLHLSSWDSTLTSSERRRLSPHIRCVLTQIDDEGNYIPLWNDAAVLTNDFLMKLKRATSTRYSSKISLKSGRQSNCGSDDEMKRRRSLKSVALAAAMANKNNR